MGFLLEMRGMIVFFKIKFRSSLTVGSGDYRLENLSMEDLVTWIEIFVQESKAKESRVLKSKVGR